MASSKVLKVEIAGDSTKAVKALKKLEGTLGGSETAASKTGDAIKRVLAGAGLAALGREAITSATDIQNASATLTGLYGNASLATKTLADLRDVASGSKLSFSVYAKTADTLAYAGVQGKDAIKILGHVGKAIVGAGGDSDNLERAGDALLKMVNAGKVGLDSLQQMSDAGVPILSGLAKHLGVTIAQVNKMASAGTISIQDVLTVMKQGIGPVWKQQEQSAKGVEKTFSASWDRMSDNAKTALGEGVLPVLKAITPILEDAAKVVQVIPAPVVGVTVAVVGAAAAWTVLGTTITGTIGVAGGWIATLVSYASGEATATAATEGLAAAMTEQAAAGDAAAGSTSVAGAAATGGAGRFKGLAGKLTIAAVAMAALGTASGKILDNIQPTSVDTDRLALSLEHLARSGKSAGELKDIGGFKSIAGDMKKLQSEGHGANRVMNDVAGGIFKVATAGQAGDDGLGRLASKVDSYDKTLAQMVSSGHPAAAKKAVKELTAAAGEQGMSADTVRSHLDDYGKAIADAKLKNADAQPPTDAMTAAFFAQVKKADDAKKAIDGVVTALKNYSDKTTGMLTANINVQSGLDTLAATLKTNGNNWDINTDAGRNNYNSLIDLKGAMLDNASAMLQQGVPLDTVTSKFSGLVDQLKGTMSKAGLSKDQIDLLITSMGLVPSTVKTKIVGNLPASERSAYNLQSTLNSLPQTTKVDVEMALYGSPGGWLGAKMPPGLKTAHAWGGDVRRGATLVGEHGPEILDGDHVIGAGRTQALLSSMGSSPRRAPSGVNLTLNVRVEGSVVTERNLTLGIRDQLLAMQRRSATPLLKNMA